MVTRAESWVKVMRRLSFAFIGFALASLVLVMLLTQLLICSLTASMAPATEGNRLLAVSLIVAVFVALTGAWTRAMGMRFWRGKAFDG